MIAWLGVAIVAVFFAGVCVALAALVADVFRAAREIPDVPEWIN